MAEDELVQKLIHQAATGDPAAMECFLLKYEPQLLRYVSRRIPEDVRRVMDPQDILQDIHFEVFRKLRDFNAAGLRSALRWLVSMARNRLIDVIRMHRAAKRGGGRWVDVEGDADDRSIVVMLQDLVIYERTPSLSAAAHELMGFLQRSVDRLPPDYRQAIQLRYMEGLSVEDAAARMGRTEGAVRMLCNRGIKLLREDLRSMSFTF